MKGLPRKYGEARTKDYKAWRGGVLMVIMRQTGILPWVTTTPRRVQGQATLNFRSHFCFFFTGHREEITASESKLSEGLAANDSIRN